MSERERIANEDHVTRLTQAIRDVKNAAADRDDVVVEMREAARGRLEILAQELEDVFSDIPPEDEQFDLAISSGAQPRLWIDATAHVGMGRDRRVYRFVRDTRNGRVVLAESTDTAPVVEAVTRYIAERIVERQRMLEGEATPLMRGGPARPAEPARVQRARPGSWREFWTGLGLVGIGAALVLILLVAVRTFPGLQ